MTPLKADQQAAERVLKAAVRRAVEMYSGTGGATKGYDMRGMQSVVVAMLATATHAAALLLDERPAKKAAARKGAS